MKHPNGEFSQIAHLARGSVTVKPGDAIAEGQALAASGESGWMDKPHIHFFVFRVTSPKDFHGVAIQFREPLELDR